MAGSETKSVIEAELLKLDAKSRALLAEKLLHSLEELSGSENEQLWAAEALRRHEELVRGMAAARPANEVLHDVRNALK